LALHLGLAVSVLHLGRPLGAWRFFLGLKTSWMSREILAFGLFSMIASAPVALLWLPVVPMSWLPAVVQPWLPMINALTPFAVGVTALTGLAGVFTSVMIYVDTRRPFWGLPVTATKFYGAAFLLGSLGSAIVFAFTGAKIAAVTAALAALAIRVALFAWDSYLPKISTGARAVALRYASRTMESHLPWTRAAVPALFLISLCATVGALLIDTPMAGGLLALAFVATFSALVIERFSFFAACPTPRMPGGVSA
jgi:DMSO reductase anchor subunit